MAKLAESSLADRLLVESLPRVAEASTTDPPFVARAAVFVRLSQSLLGNMMGQIGRWGNNPAKQATAASEAHDKLAQLVRSVFGETRAPQVMQSQLCEDIMFATGMELTVLRLERARDFSILSVFVKQLQYHQVMLSSFFVFCCF